MVCLSPSEPCRKFGSDRDTVCVQDSGWPRERPITYRDHFGRILYCVHSTQYSLLVITVAASHDSLHKIRANATYRRSSVVCVSINHTREPAKWLAGALRSG